MAGTPKLIILSEQFRGRTFELDKDQLSVGRVEERDICIKDATISTYHCKFIRTGNTYTVEDQGSTNGTRVNNAPVTSQKLQNSDILQIGGVELLYDCDDKTMTTMVTQTQTNIDINAADGTQTFRSIDQKGFQEKKRSGALLQQRLLILVIVVLFLLMAGLVFILIKNVKGGENSSLYHSPVHTSLMQDQLC